MLASFITILRFDVRLKIIAWEVPADLLKKPRCLF